MTPGIAASHRVPLDGTRWSLWRDVALRSTGFPADMVLALCDEALARSADLDGQANGSVPAYDVAYADATRRLSRAIADTAADPAFREAVTWQNPGLVDRVLDCDLPATRRSKDRNREIVIASYLQRYCLKNDTIGFFGPVGWATVQPDTDGLTVLPGKNLLAQRNTYFEVWAIDKIAETIASQGRVLGWLRPKRIRSVFVAGNVLHRTHGKQVKLTDAELAILQACDGNHTINDMLTSTGVPDARAVLGRLAELGVLRIDLEGPVDAWPERLLTDQLERIEDPPARNAALAPVRRMIEARDAVAARAGDPAGLRQALTDLASVFEEITGSSATRRAGEPYAGRSLVYQDAVRDVRIEIGAAVTEALAKPLGLILDSAGWLVTEITAQYRELFLSLFDSESARAGGGAVPLARLLFMASPHYMTPYDRSFTEITAASMADFQRRWQAVLNVPPSVRRHQVRADEIADRVAELFPWRPIICSGARQHSPDLMIAAASPEAVRRGDFFLVLGELHMATNTLEGRLFVEQHPDPARLIAAETADHDGQRVSFIPDKDARVVSSRTSPPSSLLPPDQVYLSYDPNSAVDPPPSATVIPAAELHVRRRGDDLIAQRASGAELDFFEVIGDVLNSIGTDAFQPLAAARHQPRVTIDRLVLSRESWTIQVAKSQWAFVKDEQRRFFEARRWRAKYGLPERAFFRVPVELKPMAVDFRSIALINQFARLIRQSKANDFASYTISEMLPDLDQLWLSDGAGRRYSSEFRCVAIDGTQRPGNPGGAC